MLKFGCEGDSVGDIGGELTDPLDDFRPDFLHGCSQDEDFSGSSGFCSETECELRLGDFDFLHGAVQEGVLDFLSFLEARGSGSAVSSWNVGLGFGAPLPTTGPGSLVGTAGGGPVGVTGLGRLTDLSGAAITRPRTTAGVTRWVLYVDGGDTGASTLGASASSTGD